MATSTEIANLALSSAGMGAIDDFDTDTTDAGQFIRQWWAVIFDEILETGDFQQFHSIANLGLVDPDANDAGLYKFLKPSDFVRIKRVLTPGTHFYTLGTDDTVLADTKELKIEYISNASLYVPDNWGPVFSRAFRSRLAAELHNRFSGNYEKAQMMNNTAIMAAKDAQSIAGQQQNRKRITMWTNRGEYIDFSQPPHGFGRRPSVFEE